MPESLNVIKQQVHHLGDAIRWACVLEATAPKAGNVYPGRSFDGLTYGDFVTAAELTAVHLADDLRPISQRMLDCVVATRAATSTNVNLGIVLLMGPLVAGFETLVKKSASIASETWPPAIAAVLTQLSLEDGGRVMEAIRVAGAGGLQQVDQWDVNQTHGPVDLLSAMRLAESRDRVARQYATGFADLLGNVVPVVSKALDEEASILGAIAQAHLRLLAAEPDSLIARKKGDQVARQVQDRARRLDPSEPASIEAFDRWLRSQKNELNPGTTADLIAAALLVLLLTD